MQPPFIKSMPALLDQAEYSDLKLVCGDSEWHTHKVILCSASEFFRAACKHDMKEKFEGSITLEDCEESVISETLKFIYTGNYSATKVNLATEYPTALHAHVAMYAAGDKFMIKSLQEQAAVRFKEYCKSNRAPSEFGTEPSAEFGKWFCDVVKLTEELVPHKSVYVLRDVQVKEARYLLHCGQEAEKLAALFLSYPQFAARFAADIAVSPRDGAFRGPVVEMRCPNYDQMNDKDLHSIFVFSNSPQSQVDLCRGSYSCPDCTQSRGGKHISMQPYYGARD